MTTPTNRPALAKAQRITKPERRVKARRMILLHAKSGAYSDYTLHPDATDAHFAKIAAETCNRAVILSRVAVLPADEASVERMMNQFQYAFNRAPVGKEIERGFAALGLTRNPQRKEK